MPGLTEATKWKQFVLYRKVPASGAINVTLALTGLGKVYFDDVTVVGHSFGGGIALGWAATHPRRVRKLVLVDSLGLSARWQLAQLTLYRDVSLFGISRTIHGISFEFT